MAGRPGTIAGRQPFAERLPVLADPVKRTPDLGGTLTTRNGGRNYRPVVTRLR
jgi:hypothetical protein